MDTRWLRKREKGNSSHRKQSGLTELCRFWGLCFLSLLGRGVLWQPILESDSHFLIVFVETEVQVCFFPLEPVFFIWTFM